MYWHDSINVLKSTVLKNFQIIVSLEFQEGFDPLILKGGPCLNPNVEFHLFSK